MLRRYQVRLQGKGFFVPVGDGDAARGFYTILRVVADNPEEAERHAIATLLQEEKFQRMVESTERESGRGDGCKVRLDSIRELSWFTWHFSRCLRSFIFYSDEDDSSQHAAEQTGSS